MYVCTAQCVHMWRVHVCACVVVQVYTGGGAEKNYGSEGLAVSSPAAVDLLSYPCFSSHVPKCPSVCGKLHSFVARIGIGSQVTP